MTDAATTTAVTGAPPAASVTKLNYSQSTRGTYAWITKQTASVSRHAAATVLRPAVTFMVSEQGCDHGTNTAALKTEYNYIKP